MKICFKCGMAKKREDFYRHPKMGDGLLGKCKECTKADVRRNRQERPEARAYDRRRYRENLKRRKDTEVRAKNWRKKYPERYAAHTAVNNAIRDGKLKKGMCEVCGSENSQGHHDDYSKPLDVRWLCPIHHADVHKK